MQDKVQPECLKYFKLKSNYTLTKNYVDKKKKKVGICGQGPSDYTDFAQFLVEEGIDTISVTPDSMLKTKKAIHKIEIKR